MGEIRIDDLFDGKTVLDYIRQNGISRAELIRLKKRDDGIMLNGERVTVRALLREGDLLRLTRGDTDEDVNSLIEPAELNIGVVFENDDIIALNKPAGMPTHPSRNHLSGTLANGAASIFEKRGVPFVFRACNRLDRDTSGIVLVAKNKGAAKTVADLIASGKVRKKYICFAEGTVTGKITVSANIKRAQPSIIERCVCGPDEGQPAVTVAEPLICGGGMTECAVMPLTGRTHQIRVHLSSAGHPVVGDTLYGRESPYISRQALHCAEMSFPYCGEKITVCAPLPEDMQRLEIYVKGQA